MTAPGSAHASTVPRHALTLHAATTSAVVAGWIGAAIAWTISSGWTDLSSMIPTYARLDQWVGACFGAFAGACILGLHARHRRDPVMPAIGAGTLLGAVSALLAVTIGLLLPLGDAPLAFVIQRVGAWALMTGLTSAALACYSRAPNRVTIAESAVIGVIGGAGAGAIFTLPGPAEVWLPIAMTTAGAAVGFAVVGPAMWRAAAVVHVMSPRDQRHTLWSLHERALEDGWSIHVADGQVANVDGTVFVYPPPAGAVLDGYPLYRAVPIARDVVLAVGRTHARVMLRRRR